VTAVLREYDIFSYAFFEDKIYCFLFVSLAFISNK